MDILLQQIINGLVLGSMYALIALGYTMVYGIIQLINLPTGSAHDRALTSWSCIGLMQDAMPGAPGLGRLLLATVIIACVVAAGAELLDRRSPTSGCATARAWHRPDHGHRHVHPAADAGHDHLEANLQTYPTLLPTTPFEVAARSSRPRRC